MSLPGNGIFVVQGEMAILVTAMRRGARWSSHSHQDDENDNLMKAFQDLKEILIKIEDLKVLDPNIFLGPFLEVIRSEETTGPVTSLALSAVNKFLSYGLIDPTHISTPTTVENIADAVTHARFVGTDQASDAVVLMKILQVLRTLMLAPEGAALTNESVCEIMLSCFRICFENRLSELLRRTAEHCLKDMVQLLFMRLPQFTEDLKLHLNMKTLKMRTGAIEHGRGKRKSRSFKYKQKMAENPQLTVTSDIKQEIPPESLLSPVENKSLSTLRANHLSTTPMTPAGNIVDMQGSISQSTPQNSHNSNSIQLAVTPEVVNQTSLDQIQIQHETNPKNVQIESLNLTDSEKENQQTENQTNVTQNQENTTQNLTETLENQNSTKNLQNIGQIGQNAAQNQQNEVQNSSEPQQNSNEQQNLVQNPQISVQNQLSDENQQSLNVTEPQRTLMQPTENLPQLSQISLESQDSLDVLENSSGALIEKAKGPKILVEAQQSSVEIQNDEYVNPRGVRFTSNQELVPLVPYGLSCVRELFRFLISLCNPHDKQNTEVMIHLGLTLLTVALEVGADSIGKYSTLLALAKNELSRNLFSLMSSERLSIFAADLQVAFLLFEALRTHLKFQLEFYLTKLMEIITSDSPKITYEHKEISLDNILQLWRIPGLVTELYINYDCDFYCSNLFEDLTKLLAKNAFPVTSGFYQTNLLSLDALLTIVETIESHCNNNNDRTNDSTDSTILEEEKNLSDIENIDSFIGTTISARQKISEKIPTRDDLMAVKNIKKWLPQGTEYFNQKPKKGIQFLQEHGVLKAELDSEEICHFLRENPGLDKKMIGEFISGRNNLQVLETFVKMFDFTDIRIDEALRLYLETFRLPGEAPLIALIMEHFAEHWHKCNGEPFANADAAFTLAYAIIMLNVDQHNHNVKKQNIPMTNEEFKRNLKKVNGGNDFDQEMLDAIYTAIKNEEIVMPAEQTGLVRENYLWKVLLRRGASKDGVYIHVPNGAFNYDLFALIWGPTVAALSFVFDKSEDSVIYQRAMKGFEKMAFISSHFGMSANFDTLILSLCKFTMLHNQSRNVSNLAIQFGSSVKSQIALKTVFTLVHQHGDILREGWKNILDLILALYSYNMLPKSLMEAEDFIEPSGKISLILETTQSQKIETGLFSSLYSYMLSSENVSQKVPTPAEEEFIDQAKKCIWDCNLEQVITDSKFLHLESLQELIKALIDFSRGPDGHKSLGLSYNENISVFFLELLLKVVIQNRDRVMSIWQTIRDHLYTLVMGASSCDYQLLLERAVIGLLRLAIRLMRNEEMSPTVLQSLRMLLLLKPSILFRISRQISFGLYELLKTSAQNIHTDTDWSIIFTLLECVGAGAQPPKIVTEDNQTEQGAKSEGECPVSSEEESVATDRGYTSDSELTKTPKHTNSRPQSPLVQMPSAYNSTGGWIFVGREGDIQPMLSHSTPTINQYSIVHERQLLAHDPQGLVKCCESLAFLVRDVAHITPYNFENCVHCIRTFVEASLHGNGRRRRLSNSNRNRIKKSTSMRRRGRINHRSPPGSDGNDEDEDSDYDDLPSGYHQVSIQLLDLMHTLHTRTAQIFRWWAEENGELPNCTSLWVQGWCPLLQGIARLCCDTRRQIRMSAITYLQRALLVHDLQTLSAPEWEACFNKVLFPLLLKLLEPLNPNDPSGVEETRMRAATVLSKVFLHHLTPLLSLTTFATLWLAILDFMDKYMHADNSDLLYEAIPESLKNMLLVMDSAKVFEGPDGRSQLWNMTWDRIGSFLPNMKTELFKDQHENVMENIPEKDVVNEPVPPQNAPMPQQTVDQIQIQQQRSSIILQPPSSEGSMTTPLFGGHLGPHLGQMVSTPIGAPNSPLKTSYAPPPPPPQLHKPSEITSSQSPIVNATHSFPVLYTTSPITGNLTTDSTVTPISLYSEYMGNPYIPNNAFNIYGTQPLLVYQQPTDQNNQNNEIIQSDVTAGNVESFQNVTEPQISYSNPSEINQDSLGQPMTENVNQFQPSNIFQSSNYFYTDNSNSSIPLGSEILFGSSSKS